MGNNGHTTRQHKDELECGLHDYWMEAERMSERNDGSGGQDNAWAQLARRLATNDKIIAVLKRENSELRKENSALLAGNEEWEREHDDVKMARDVAIQRAGDLERLATSPGAAAIAAERRRQVEAEGWSPEHDDGHARGELAAAASCYAWGAWYEQDVGGLDADTPPEGWPWGGKCWKPTGPRRDLIKAGALIAAELDRLARTEVQE